jgi:D-psicose/D-tagatose/L-ribulose 3-epimerase
VNRYETNVLNTASQGVEMCKRVGAPNVKVHLDVYHMNIEESDITAAIMETGEYLGYFHTGDSHRGYMGSGSIDLAGVFRALVRANYQGPITFESFSSRVVGQPLEGI